MTQIGEIVRAAIPGANDEMVDFILWNRTPYPFFIDAKTLYHAARKWRGMLSRNITPCELCDRPAVEGKINCSVCEAALENCRRINATKDSEQREER